MAPKHDNRLDPRRGPQAASTDDLANRIQKHIAGKARGRVRDLHVVCTDDVIILQGRTRTQHDKQLVQEAVFDVADHARVANRIVVCC
jgi:chromosomal replication initiation ATPase DnaA